MKVIELHSGPKMEFFGVDTSTAMPLPYFAGGVSAGFPSPADDFLEDNLDFNKQFIKNPSSTFYVRVKGNSMIDAGISDKDILVVDRSLDPKTGDIAVCFLDGEFTVKHILIEKEIVWLVPKNDEFEPIKVTAENELTIWGVVINVIKSFR
ncbi:LexA family protein [Flavobacterium sp. PLA-1-15]|uniref:LexA family protein n=1 Tax=Flavobacterium sp. PLA-1-15 TaxID=3380533 RepID=UPI003B7B739A